MPEIMERIGGDATIAKMLANSLSRASFSGHGNTNYWDSADSLQFNSLVSNDLSNPHDTERQVIKQQLKLFKPKSILDSGCGLATEYRSYSLDSCLARATYVGVDRSQKMLDIARNRYPGINLIKADLSKLPFESGSFDAVLLKHVLEHQPDGFEQALTEAVRVARKCVIINFFHAPLPFNLPTIHITDRDGYANHWYGKKSFEEFLEKLPAQKYSSVKCLGAASQTAVVYTLEI